jgi:hypothetical protein
MPFVRAAIALVVVFSMSAPIFGQTPAMYIGPNNGNWNTTGNWNDDMMNTLVPINVGGNTYAVTIPASRTVLFDVPGVGNQISSLNVATTGGISLTPVGGGGLEVLGAATLGGTYRVTGDKTFRAEGPGTSFINTRLLTDAGGEIVVDADIDQYTGVHTATTVVGPTVGLAIFQATGADGIGTGSLLDLKSLTQLLPTEASIGNGFELTVHAANKGTVDLRNVITAGLTGSHSGDRLKFFIEGGASGNGNIRLDNLATIDRVRFDVRIAGYTLPKLMTVTNSDFIVASGASLMAGDDPANNLTSISGGAINVASGGTLSIPEVANITNASVTLAGSAQFTTAPLADINGSRFLLSGGVAFSNVTDPIYTGSHSGDVTILQATGVDGMATGSLLDLQSLTQLLPTEASVGNGFELTVHAANKGTVDLRNVTTAGLTGSQSADRLQFFVEGGASGNGNIRLDNLATIDHVRFDVRAGGQLTLGDLTKITRSEMLLASAAGALPAAFVEASGSLQLDATSSLSMQAGAVLRLGGDLSFTTSTEANFLTGLGIIEMQGPNTRVLEVGGEAGATGSNFGIGQLAVGTNVVPTTLVLVDAFDNGNRTGLTETDDEVLYLFGIGGQDGLKINTDSIVVLYGIDVYAFETADGQQEHLNGLFPFGVSEITYDQGKLRLIDIIDGDYNGDGFVNAADYTVWRNTLGMNGLNLRADGDGDGTVTPFDYGIWKSNYGANIFDALPPGTAAGQVVPEPGTLVLIIAGALIACTLRRRSLR